MGGIVLLNGTVKSTQTRTARVFLFLTGISSTLLLIFYIGYEWFRLNGNHDLEASIEALLYLLTLIFLGCGNREPGLDQETNVTIRHQTRAK